ncbi:Transposase [Jannaschia seohaensis]|uniref:Transposase n=1 Tax=Jannaschia seohaensis TaxID=475081 RepID=A0A2Y9B0G5_9RHOB|nr:transposase [Jannaschia seohaensis]SSA48367.1 Transposase [Jannaschia seohaensis]
MLTGGNVADCIAAETLLERLPPHALVVLGDKGYDSTALREQVKRLGAFPNIPPRKKRKRRIFWCRDFYRDRNAIERMFGRLKDVCRIATRYDRRADVLLSAVTLAATVSCWL